MTVTLLKAKWIVGHEDGRHVLYEDGEIAISGDSVIHVGGKFPGAAARTIDYGNALIGPGFIDLDAVSDLDTTVLGFDNQPAAKSGPSIGKLGIDLRLAMATCAICLLGSCMTTSGQR